MSLNRAAYYLARSKPTRTNLYQTNFLNHNYLCISQSFSPLEEYQYSNTNSIPTVLLVRNFNTNTRLYEKEGVSKPSSKVEVTVQKLKEEQKLKQQECVVSKPSPDKAAGTVEKAPVKKTLKQRIVNELLHYYHGFRLLFIDINVSRKLIWRILNGKSLTRREHRLLVRTTADMFRLLPFSVFIIVPFMELLLPVAIKLFPGMLPSTFQTATEKEDKLKQSLKVKLEMAKFLTQTLDDMTLQHKDHKSELAKEFSEWFTKMRQSGAQASNEEIMKFSKLFEDEITLDSLSRPQLTALCRVLEINTLGTTNFLRFQLRMKLRSLAADDKLIQREGIDTMTLSEVQQACRARGMRAYGMPEHRLRRQLTDWINLSLNEKVPPSLLLLSRALMLPENVPVSDKLKATISVLPETIVTQTKAAIGEREGKIDNKTKIEVIKEEERKIHEERQEAKEEERRKLAETSELLVDPAKTISTKDTAAVVDSRIPTSGAPSIAAVPPKVSPIPSATVSTKKPIMEVKKDATEFTKKDLAVVEDALDTLSKDKNSLVIEKEVIKDIKEEIADYQEDVQELQQAIVAAEKPKDEIQETKGAKRLLKKVNKMITKMDTVVQELENKESEKKAKSLQQAQTCATETQSEQEQRKAKGEILIEELMEAIKKVKNVPDENRLKLIENILSKIDTDKDGHIKVEDVLKVIDIVEKEDGHMSTKQLDELVQLLKKEEVIEKEEKKEKEAKQSSESTQSKINNAPISPVPGTKVTPKETSQQKSTVPPSSGATKDVKKLDYTNNIKMKQTAELNNLKEKKVSTNDTKNILEESTKQSVAKITKTTHQSIPSTSGKHLQSKCNENSKNL